MARIVVGLAQYPSSYSHVESLERLRGLLSSSRVEADLIVLPEYSDISPAGLTAGEIRSRALGLDDNPFLGGLEGLSREYGSFILAGVLERNGGCIYSSLVLVEPGGGARRVYRKRLLFDAMGYRESRVLCPGEEPPPVFMVKGLPVGAAVCYEIRFPEVARCLALRGAVLLAYPSAWYAGPLKEDHFVLSARSRALENTVYVAAVSHGGGAFTGRSLLAGPLGEPLLDLGHGPRYAEAVVETSVVEEARRMLPVLRDAREKLGAGRLCGLEEAEQPEEEAGGEGVGEPQQHRGGQVPPRRPLPGGAP